MARNVIFENHRFPVEDDVTLEEAQELLGELNPAILTAEGTEDAQGDYVFTKKAGTKGC
jgi:hypothetical protein